MQFAHEIAGAACTRCSLRPLIFEGNFLHNSGASCRETADAYRRGCLKSQIGNLRCDAISSRASVRLRYEMASRAVGLRPRGFGAAAFATRWLAEPKLAKPAKAGGPGRTRTCNQTVMSGQGREEGAENIDDFGDDW